MRKQIGWDSKGQMREDVMALWNAAWDKAKAEGFPFEEKQSAEA